MTIAAHVESAIIDVVDDIEDLAGLLLPRNSGCRG
jgi:hypothetical protein